MTGIVFFFRGLRAALALCTDVRFDVFSPVHNTLKHRFRERSFMLMRERRRRGAFCLVVALKGKAVDIDGSGCSGDQERKREDGKVEAGVSSRMHILGTLECSMHEFDGTPLAVETEGITDKITRCGRCISISVVHFVSFCRI